MAVTYQITVDCADPQRLVDFWSVALGYVPAPPLAGFDSWTAYWRHVGVPEEELADALGDDRIVDPDGRAPMIWFQQVPEPKAGKNRLHLDLKVGGGRDVPLAERRGRVRAEAERLQRAGATLLGLHETEGVDHVFAAMRDPEGNEFCVV